MTKKSEKYTYAIIGLGAAAVAAIEGIRKRDTEGSIVVIGREKYRAYSRPLTSYLIGGLVKKENIFFRDNNFYKVNSVTLKLGRTVQKLDDKLSKLQLDDGSEISFDKLLISSGGDPKTPDIHGCDVKGVFTLRTLDDAEAISKRAETAKTAVMIGGGFVSLKAAEALYKRGLNIVIVISSNRILSQMIDELGSAIIESRLKKFGWQIFTNDDVVDIRQQPADQQAGHEGAGNAAADSKGAAAASTNSTKGVRSVSLKDGQVINAELVVVGKGVDPSLDFIKDTKIKKHWGIYSNEALETSVKGIFVAGDVAETRDITLDTTQVNAVWPNAMEQGDIAGQNMAGAKISYNGSFRMNSIEFFGLPVISIGVARLPNKDYKEEHIIDTEREIYRKIVTKGNKLVGAILIGKIDKAGIYAGLIKDRADISAFKDQLLNEDFNLASIPKDLRMKKMTTESYI